ncbi:MAG: GxxExxY protein [Desulfobacteraceae bacterium]|nr:GxxExxY protein [Desulfobacteraceae bacterium]
MNADSFKHKEIIDIILRSFYEVYNELGDGFDDQRRSVAE